MEILVNHSQFIHCKVSNSEGMLSWTTAIYASPNPSTRNFLWKVIDVLADTVRGPWILAGDFIRYISEKKKKRGRSARLSEFAIFSITVALEIISMI